MNQLAKLVRFALLLECVVTSGCTDFEFKTNFGVDCGNFRLVPGECVDARHPFKIVRPPRKMAPGAAASVSLVVHESLTEFEISSSDPTVLSAEVIDDQLALHAFQTGQAEIEATTADGTRLLERVFITVEPIADAVFVYAPTGATPVTELAGLTGTSDHVLTVFRSANGDPIAATGTVEFSVEGPLAVGGDRERRWSDLTANYRGSFPTGEVTALTFGEEGLGQLTARTLEGDEFSLPIQVVSAPTDFAFETEGAFQEGLSQILFLRGRTPTGIPVAGVRGVWSIEPADTTSVSILDTPASEALVQPLVERQLTVTVDVGGRIVRQEFTVEPR